MMRCRSPVGGSTLMTSAPKSDKITAAPGPAMKLARSTTFSPEKMLSLFTLLSVGMADSCAQTSLSLELRRALLEEGGGAFSLVVGAGAQAEERCLQRLTFVLAGLHSLVHRFERILQGNRSVGEDLRQNRFGAFDE